LEEVLLKKEGFIFGTVGTPRSAPDKPGGTVGSIQYLASLDLRAFEIGWVRSVRVSESTCLRIKETGQESGVQLSVHAPYYINLNADDEEWPKSRKRLMDAAEAGFLSGASDIIFHPGSYFERPAEKVLEVAIPRLHGCVEELRAADNTVTLRPETMGKGAMLGSLEDTLTMSQEIEGVEPCLDFAHLHARAGDGSMNSYEEWTEILDTYEQALGKRSLRRLHCHLSGIDYTEAGEQNHLMMADSDFDLDALLQALIDKGCAGRILCESPEDMDKDALRFKARLAELRGKGT
jgi:deoxyribonuclease-4